MKHPIYYPERLCDYPDTFVRAMETGGENIPAVLPELSETVPVETGNSQEAGENEPVTPLPNPGEGGPVFPGTTQPSLPTRPSVPSNPQQPSGSATPPIFRPVFPGTSGGSSVTIIPGITFPCFNCTTGNLGRVRMLNASTGYQPFNVYLGSWLIASQFGNGDITSYVQSATGSQTLTVSGANGYVYLQKQIQVRPSASMTVAIINTASGLDLQEISDISCNAPASSSCLRAANLSMNLGPFDVAVGNQNNSFTAFTNVRYQEITPYTSFSPGWYQISVSRSGAFPANAIATAAANMSAGISYTLYIFNAPAATEGLRTMVVSN